MENQNFQPIFDYIDERIDTQTEQLRSEMATKADIERVLNAIDSFAKESKEAGDKTAILEVKTERIEHWVMKAAEKTEISYKP